MGHAEVEVGAASTHAAKQSWWESTSWFNSSSAPWPGLQASSQMQEAATMDVDTAPPSLQQQTASAKVGGANAQNRFAGNSATPMGTTAAKDQVLLQSWRQTAHGPPIGGAVAHSRFNDRKRGKGFTCDGSVPPLSRPVGHQASTWVFSLSSWRWESHSDGAALELKAQAVRSAKPEAQLRQCPASGYILAGARGRVEEYDKPSASDKAAVAEQGFAAVGGLEQQKKALRELLVLPLRFPKALQNMGAKSSGGVLLKGPPGTGKTFLGVAVAREAGAHLVMVNGSDVAAGEGGHQKLEDAFKEAHANAPAVLLLDEVDVMCPSRASRSDTESRAAAKLIAALDKQAQEGIGRGVIVIATTSRPEALDQSVRRHGRLGHELTFGTPSLEEREDILRTLTAAMPLANSVDLHAVAASARGRVGADLAGICLDAALVAVREAADQYGDDVAGLEDMLLEVKLSCAHFEEALLRSPPCVLRDWALPEVPDVRWQDIGGLASLKRELQELVQLPLQHPEKLKQFGMRPSSGALLYGPPGCGKTMVAKAVAACSGANFISIRGPELLDKWLGGSEANVRQLFEAARQAEPCVLFFDEIDALAVQRSGKDALSARVLNQLLTEIDGIEADRHVFVLAATNRPEMLDTAIMRPGRLDAMIKVPLPDETARAEIMQAILQRWPLPLDVPLGELVSATEGMSGADVTDLLRVVATLVIRDDIAAERRGDGSSSRRPQTSISRSYFDRAITTSARRSVSEAEVKRYEELEAALKEGSLEQFLQQQATKARAARLDQAGQDFVKSMIQRAEESQAKKLTVQLETCKAQLIAAKGRVEALERALRAAGLDP